jgi:hypothetical protein
MKFSEARPIIKQYTNDLSYFGGGESEIPRIEKEIGHSLPNEFKVYLEYFVPKKDFSLSSFYQGFSLYGKTKLKLENSEAWGYFPKIEGNLMTPFVIGDDSSIAFITDLSQENCPIYRVDERWDWQPQAMTDTFADFLAILFYREYATNKWLDDFGLYGNLEANRLNEQLDNEVEEFILRLCPGSVELWT